MTYLTREEAESLAAVVKNVCRTAMAIPLGAARAAVAQANYEESVMPIMDPTQFQHNLKQVEATGQIVRAFLRFREELEEIREGLGE